MSYTEKARAASPGSDVYFEHRIDPEGILPQDGRRRRAQAAKRLHFARLAMRSAQARRKWRTRPLRRRGTMGTASSKFSVPRPSLRRNRVRQPGDLWRCGRPDGRAPSLPCHGLGHDAPRRHGRPRASRREMFVHRAEIEWDGTFGPSVTITGNVTICRGPGRGHVETFLGCQGAMVPRARRLYCDDARGSPS